MPTSLTFKIIFISGKQKTILHWAYFCPSKLNSEWKVFSKAWVKQAARNQIENLIKRVTGIKMDCIVHRNTKLEIFRALHSWYFKTCSSYFKQSMFNDQTAKSVSEKSYNFIIFLIPNKNTNVLVK